MEPQKKDENLDLQNEILSQSSQELDEQKNKNTQSEQEVKYISAKQGGYSQNANPQKPKWRIIILIILGCCGIGLVVYLVFFGIHYCDSNEYDDFENPNVDKPIIYLYPQETTEISVKLGHPEKITVSYPAYNNGWNVLAEPNGDLTDITSNKKLYGLYWEGKDSTLKVTDEGFVIPGNQTAEFLDEKLAILGLNDYEREEFIIYWLPKMQDNIYNYIRFATDAEIEENMPLEIIPKPDTIIRVMMITKPLDSYKEVGEQNITSKVRSGYTVVEWGGSIDNLTY